MSEKEKENLSIRKTHVFFSINTKIQIHFKNEKLKVLRFQIFNLTKKTKKF